MQLSPHRASSVRPVGTDLELGSMLSRLPRRIVIDSILAPVRKEPKNSEAGAIAYLRLRKFGLSDRKARGLIWSVSSGLERIGRARARR